MVSTSTARNSGSAGQRVAQIAATFRAGDTRARFAIGREALPHIQGKIDAISVGQLRAAGCGQTPRYPQVLDARRGIVQFGPDRMPTRGVYSQPVAVLKEVLGVQRLPEPVHSTGNLILSLHTTVSQGMQQFFSALQLVGAECHVRASEYDLRTLRTRGFGSCWPVATFGR